MAFQVGICGQPTVTTADRRYPCCSAHGFGANRRGNALILPDYEGSTKHAQQQPKAARYTEVLQSKSLPPSTAPIVTGWSDSCRAGFAPAEGQRLSTAH